MRTGRLLAVLLFAVTMMSGARAQDNQDSAAPPETTGGQQPDVARVSLIHGDVSMQRGDSGDWVAATLNTPLVRGDQVATSEKSRAEIQLDYANVLRLAAHSQVKIADLTRTRIQIQVSQGYANYSVFKGSEADVEINTPNVAVKPLRPGRYRVQVNSDFETDVIVRNGEAEITTPQGSTTVKEGQLITIRGADNPEYKVADAPSGDDWDRFNKDRDRVIKDAAAWQKTNPYYTGSHDLDAYGRWVYVPGYGDVWQPYSQGPGWAPYQAGRWVWEPYYGWTWVSYEPWGWAPYHYGRWFFYGSSWVWWPGPIYPHYRPLWAPAFVFFVGFGGPHVGFGFGSIGWCPVGPFDAFYPWYGRGFNRINVVNITNINVINRGFGVVGPLGIRGRHPVFSNASLILTNARVRGGITSVSREDFGRGVMTNRRFGVDAAQIREAHMVQGNLGVAPTRENLGVRGGANVAGPQFRGNERFFTRQAPPSGPPSFHDQSAQMQRVIEAHGGSATNGENGRGEGRFGGNNAEAGRMGQPAGGETKVDTKIGTRTEVHGNGPEGVATGAGENGRGSVRMGGNGQTGSPNNSSATGAGNGQAPASSPASSRGWTRFGGREQSGPGNSVQSGQGGSRPGENSPASRNISGPEDRGSGRGVQGNSTPQSNQNSSRPGENSPASRNISGPEDRGSNRGVQGNSTPQSNQNSSRPGENSPAYRNIGGPEDRGSGSGPEFRRGVQGNPGPQSQGNQSPSNGGWQRFPSGGESRGNSGNGGTVRDDRPMGSSGKPPLVMDKQVITPRDSGRQSYTPSYHDSRGPSGSPPRSEVYSGPSPSSRGSYSGPPSHGSYSPPPSSRGSYSGGGGSHGSYSGGGGHSSSGGGGHSSGGSHSSGSSGKSSSGHH